MRGAWLKAAEGKSKRDLETMVAARYPQAPQPDAIRNLPSSPVIVSGAPPALVKRSDRKHLPARRKLRLLLAWNGRRLQRRPGGSGTAGSSWLPYRQIVFGLASTPLRSLAG